MKKASVTGLMIAAVAVFFTPCYAAESKPEPLPPRAATPVAVFTSTQPDLESTPPLEEDTEQEAAADVGAAPAAAPFLATPLGLLTGAAVVGGSVAAADGIGGGGEGSLNTAQAELNAAGSPVFASPIIVDRRDVTVTVHDHGAIDGDVIDVGLGALGNLVLPNHTLLGAPGTGINLNLMPGVNQLIIQASDEGEHPGVTVTVQVTNVINGPAVQQLRLNAGAVASLNITAP